MPVYKRPFMSRVSIEEGFDIMSRIESVCGDDTHMYVFGDFTIDKEIKSFCDSNERVDFVHYSSDQRSPKGRTNKFNNIYATIDDMEWDMCVWLDSNNIYSDWYKDEIANKVSNRVDFFGAARYTMVGLKSGMIRHFKPNKGHVIGPGKGWSRQAFDKGVGAHAKMYESYCNPFLYTVGKGYDADFRSITNRSGVETTLIESEHNDVLDIKLGDDLNQVEKYSESKAPFGGLDSRSRDAMLVLLKDYGESFDLPVEFRNKISSLLR